MNQQQQENPNVDPTKSKLIPPYIKAISGSIGGIMEASCLQPIDVIKTRLQLDRSGAYKGILHCGNTIYHTEGVRALWKGLTPFATHLTLKYALRMGSNALLQSAFKDSETGKLSAQGRLLSGFGAGVIEALVIVTPFEVVKIRLQQQRGLSPELLKYKGPVHCARMIVREEGILGLWAGASPTVMRNGTNQAAMFTAKNTFDVLLWKKHEGDGKTLHPWQSMISGFLAGTAGPVCTGPFDVVKTRLMAQSRSADGELKYKGMIHAIRTIYAEEGIKALWRGLLPRLMRIPPGQAIMWGVADQRSLVRVHTNRWLLEVERSKSGRLAAALWLELVQFNKPIRYKFMGQKFSQVGHMTWFLAWHFDGGLCFRTIQPAVQLWRLFLSFCPGLQWSGLWVDMVWVGSVLVALFGAWSCSLPGFKVEFSLTCMVPLPTSVV
ncbi:hypothetical protein ACFE04_012164 [Oxalis oulophora]